MNIFGHDHARSKEHLLGTHRARSPRATLERFLPLCPRFGITRLANVTGLDYIGLPVYQCVRPNSRTLSVSQGKGLTPEAAKVSALMESIEGWHGETMPVSTCHASVRRLAARASVVSLELLQRTSPRPPDPDLLMPWVQSFDIMQGEVVWVPYEVVDLDRVHSPSRRSPFQRTSKGLASGNHLLEAVLHGLCEVIEHDAHVLWHLDESDPLGTNKLVDLETIDDPACREVLGLFHAAGFTIAIHDITTDIGIPSYQCLAIDSPESFRSLGYTWGQGCHTSRGVALLRALTEAAQSRLTFIAGARDDLTYDDYAIMQNQAEAESLVELLRRTPATIDFASRPSLATASFEGDIELVLERLRAAGCERVLVVDLTHPELQIPVAKVIVPGLEGPLLDAASYVPGRRALQRAVRRAG